MVIELKRSEHVVLCQAPFPSLAVCGGGCFGSIHVPTLGERSSCDFDFIGASVRNCWLLN